eukprot:TRINITY_DN14147_c0_g1_i1.p1 TRINITY_DN14147_c0_g1~~TRINITY_DN14147_c0_g1_i1.p1  ORF type:complete len:246 (+),score=36.18 TRINITY_DN14147_c0_g1_i1:22-759(+)
MFLSVCLLTRTCSSFFARRFSSSSSPPVNVLELLAVPKAQRDPNWRLSFLSSVSSTPFSPAKPQYLKGPDGFPYYVLSSQENVPADQQVSIESQKDFLLDKGLGVVINPSSGAEWVFSYGDIVNLHLTGKFRNEEEILGNEETVEDNMVIVRQADDTILPPPARKALRMYLEKVGKESPKLAVIARDVGGRLEPNLCFDFFEEDFENRNQLSALLSVIRWFLPKHYRIVTYHKRNEELVKKMSPL